MNPENNQTIDPSKKIDDSKMFMQGVENSQKIINSQPTTELPTSSRKRFPKWLKIVSAVLLFFTIVGAITYFVVMNTTNAPKQISDQFVNSIQSGNTEESYKLTSNAFKEATSIDSLENIINQIRPSLQGEEKTIARSIKASTGNKDTAVIVYKVDTSEGSNYIKVVLQKNNDTWEVLNFRSSDTELDSSIE